MDWASEKDMGIMGTEALALDPKDPAKLYVLGGTDYFSGSRTWILRSSDYGETFDTTDVTSLFKAHGNGMGRQSGEKLAVDPYDGKVVWCGSRLKGLFKSVDGGKTWVQADTLGSKAGGSTVNDNGISFVIPDSTRGALDGVAKTLFVGVGRTGANLYRSDDGGKTFKAVTGGPTKLMPLRAALTPGSLFVSYANSPGPHGVTSGALWKYAIASGTWTDVTPKDDQGNLFGDGSQARYGALGGISVDPQDPDHLVCATLSHYGGQWRHPGKKDGWGEKLFESKDGGASWRLLNGYATNEGTNANIDPLDNRWIEGQSIHWAGSMEFDPFDTKRVWVTSGNGIYRSDDVSVAAPIFTFAARDLEEVVPFEALSIPGGPMVTAIGDYDGSAYDDIGQSFALHSPQMGTTLSIGYAPLTHALLRIGTRSDWSTGSEIKSNVGYLSQDMGRTWTKIDSAPAGKGMTALSADGKVFFHRAEGGATIWRSSDNGKTWTKVTGHNEGQSTNSPLVPDPVDASILYLLDIQGVLWRSTDTGKTFVNHGSVQDNAKNLWQATTGKIAVRPGVTGEFWVPLDQAQPWVKGGYSTNGLAYTTDGGATFGRIDTSLVQVCIAVGLGKAAEGASYPTLFLWGSANHGPIGMYRSTDKGASWIRINDDRHQFGGVGNGTLVRGDWNVFGRVYMSSAGRGLIYGNVGTLPPPTGIAASAAARAHRISLHGNVLHVEGSLPADARVVLMDVSGRVRASLALRGGTASLAGLDLRGLTIASLRSGATLLAKASFVRP